MYKSIVCDGGIGRRRKKGQQYGYKPLPRETDCSGGSGRVRRGCGVNYIIKGANPFSHTDDCIF